MKKEIDIICVGEVLIDFIGNQLERSIKHTSTYQRHLGGSPTNVAINMSRLGLKVVLVATLGNDGLGDYSIEKLVDFSVDVKYIKKLKNAYTSNIIISRTLKTPEFIPYRVADYHIEPNQIPDELIKKAKIFHTTCFALSKEPAQSTILRKAKIATMHNCKLSIDVNYSDKIWLKRNNALEVIKQFCQFNPLVKISLDDMYRLFGKEITSKQMFHFFHQQNVEIVCLTLGSKGVELSQKGERIISLPAVKIDHIKDVTGAGDAFWSGFLYAYLKKQSLQKCLKNALKLAAIKLQNIGQFKNNGDALV